MHSPFPVCVQSFVPVVLPTVLACIGEFRSACSMHAVGMAACMSNAQLWRAGYKNSEAGLASQRCFANSHADARDRHAWWGGRTRGVLFLGLVVYRGPLSVGMPRQSSWSGAGDSNNLLPKACVCGYIPSPTAWGRGVQTVESFHKALLTFLNYFAGLLVCPANNHGLVLCGCGCKAGERVRPRRVTADGIAIRQMVPCYGGCCCRVDRWVVGGLQLSAAPSTVVRVLYPSQPASHESCLCFSYIESGARLLAWSCLWSLVAATARGRVQQLAVGYPLALASWFACGVLCAEEGSPWPSWDWYDCQRTLVLVWSSLARLVLGW